ncbi:MAG TPA: LLM class flavin-dependent oxidoreductase [Acidimicrobiales bacterium]|nr:LLM class flavin-dependent oxidoreductase [Acidimicrobiales bacterium]
MTLTLSCAFATSLQSHEHARVAEELGYARAFFYDSPALYPDVWVQVCRAAERTERIGLGPGVLIPSLRHPLVTASAIGTLVSLAGRERVIVGVGSGFTGRLAMGQRPLRWSYVSRYVKAVKALLSGDEVEWDGAMIKMIHPAGFAPPRPIQVPFIFGAAGVKGAGVAREIGDGVFGAPVPVPGFDWSVVLMFGTVLDKEEDPGGDRVMAAAGHAGGVLLHWAVEHNQLDLVPDGADWEAAYHDVPSRSRHLALHSGHLVEINRHDRPFITGELLVATGAAMSPQGLRDRLAAAEAGGGTEVAYQPAGPDIPRELEAFAEAVRGS